MPTRQHRPIVVVGYDGSAPSLAALRLAAARAGRRGRLLVVHAYGSRTPAGGLAEQVGVRTETADHGRALLDAIPLTGDDLLDVRYETVLVPGPAASALADVGREHEADEIVVGARGGGFIQSLLGSVSRQLLQISDRPVVVVPALAERRLTECADDRADSPPAPAGR